MKERKKKDKLQQKNKSKRTGARQSLRRNSPELVFILKTLKVKRSGRPWHCGIESTLLISGKSFRPTTTWLPTRHLPGAQDVMVAETENLINKERDIGLNKQRDR